LLPLSEVQCAHPVHTEHLRCVLALKSPFAMLSSRMVCCSIRYPHRTPSCGCSWGYFGSVVVPVGLDATDASLWLGLLLTLLASLIYLKRFYFYILFLIIIASYTCINHFKVWTILWYIFYRFYRTITFSYIHQCRQTNMAAILRRRCQTRHFHCDKFSGNIRSDSMIVIRKHLSAAVDGDFDVYIYYNYSDLL